MNRVEIVNLAGRAYHIERGGAEALDAWLARARESLSNDPDRDDLLLDFEQSGGAIGDLQLGVGAALSQRDGHALTARLYLKLPTGDAEHLSGSEATDITAYASLAARLPGRQGQTYSSER